MRFSWLHPLEVWAEFHDVGFSPPPVRSKCPTRAPPLVASLVLLLFGGMIGGYLFWQTDQFADRIETANNQVQIVRALQA